MGNVPNYHFFLQVVIITPISEKIYNFVPFLMIIILCLGSFVSCRICTKNIKNSRILLGLLCSLTIISMIGLVSNFVFHSFSFANFLVKSISVIVFGILGSIGKSNSGTRRVSRNTKRKNL